MRINMEGLVDSIQRYLWNLNLKYNKMSEKDMILTSLRKAQEELRTKEKYFNHATDPDLIDFAIYDMEASKKKYSYLLKKIKKAGNL